VYTSSIPDAACLAALTSPSAARDTKEECDALSIQADKDACNSTLDIFRAAE
jgi:hypothetical protein